MVHIKKPSPLVGEGVNRQVDGRGKCEQKGEQMIVRVFWTAFCSFAGGICDYKCAHMNLVVPIKSIYMDKK